MKGLFLYNAQCTINRVIRFDIISRNHLGNGNHRVKTNLLSILNSAHMYIESLSSCDYEGICRSNMIDFLWTDLCFVTTLAVCVASSVAW